MSSSKQFNDVPQALQKQNKTKIQTQIVTKIIQNIKETELVIWKTKNTNTIKSYHKERTTQIQAVTNVKGEITMDSTEIQIILKYFKSPYCKNMKTPEYI